MTHHRLDWCDKPVDYLNVLSGTQWKSVVAFVRQNKKNNQQLSVNGQFGFSSFKVRKIIETQDMNDMGFCHSDVTKVGAKPAKPSSKYVRNMDIIPLIPQPNAENIQPSRIVFGLIYIYHIILYIINRILYIYIEYIYIEYYIYILNT
jgi:hypothetical protein